MQAKSDAQLLREYAEHGSESAFAEIVARHTNLVYSAAFRQVESPDVAADVTQSVFIGLARGARSLSRKLAENASLAGWLCRCARNLSLNLRRDEFRRHSHERLAMENLDSMPDTTPDWERLRPVLDEAMSELSEPDYDALVIRFFKNQDLRAVGLALGVSDDAAQKRVSRALDKLRDLLSQRGITTSATALTMILSANAVQAAPVGLVATISTAAALAGTAVQTSTAIAVTKTIAMTTLQKTLITVTLVAAVGTGIYEIHQASRLREQNQALQQRQTPLADQIEQLTRERDDATRQLAALRGDNERLNQNSAELLKLRAEVSRLRKDAKELASSKSDPFVQSALDWKARAAELKRRLEQMPEQQIPQLQLLTEEDWLDVAKHAKLDTDTGFRRALGQLRDRARGNLAPMMSVALMNYTRANDGQLPDDILKLKSYFKSPLDDAILQQYQLLYTGKLSDVPKGQWLITEKSPLLEGFDMTLYVGYDAFGVEQSGPLEEALGKFYEANAGQEPTDLSQLFPYVKDPAVKASLEKLKQSPPTK